MAEPVQNDEYAAANYAYTEAAWAYEDALQRRVSPEEQATAREGLRAAANRLHRAMTARVAARQDAPTFAHLLADPMQQLDPNSEVLASIVAYQNATTATASTTNPTARHEERPDVACAVLHRDSQGRTIPCPGYPHQPVLAEAPDEVRHGRWLKDEQRYEDGCRHDITHLP